MGFRSKFPSVHTKIIFYYLVLHVVVAINNALVLLVNQVFILWYEGGIWDFTLLDAMAKVVKIMLCFLKILTTLFYSLSITRILIYVIGFSRYSTFYVLYPSGITSEVYLIYLSIPYVKVMKLEERKKNQS